MSLTVDAHQHFWDHSQPFDYAWQDSPEYEAIRGNFLPEDLAPHLEAVGVDRTILVQTQNHGDETAWLLELADQHDFIAGVVGWVDLADAACEQQLQKLTEHPKFVGVRHAMRDQPDASFLLRDDVVRGLSVLQSHRVPFDLMIDRHQLEHVPALAERLPDLPLVIDHLARPAIRDGDTTGWADALKAAAARENVYCKLSALTTQADHHNWTVGDLRPFVLTALEAFGPDRCMFGSDWPVSEIAGSYQQTYQALVTAIKPTTAEQREQIFGRTAASVYQLTVGSERKA